MKRLVFCMLFAAALLFAACAPQAAVAPSPTPLPAQQSPIVTAPATVTNAPATPTRFSISVANTNTRVEIALFDPTGRTAISSAVGSTITVTIAFRPYVDIVTKWSDGTTTQYSTGAPPNTVSEMRYCAGLGRTCTLPDKWLPFAGEQRIAVPLEWVGLKDYGVTAQFRDASGKTVPAGPNRGESASNWVPITGNIDERTPVASQPPAIQTAIAQARAAFPVTGSIKVGEGHTVGGKAGTTISIRVQFQASSSAGAVTEMRVKFDPMGRCLTPDEMGNAAWEPFVAEKTYPYSIPINFSTFKLHVQYRDAKGILSPVYCGDIAVEGNP